MAKIAYNVDTNTKLLDVQKQFIGGLKTVDTDDALGDVYLRDVENISISEFGFLERRYGLIKEDLEADFLNGNEVKIQGYFEYRKGNIYDQILFINGSLYLNKDYTGWRKVTTLYQQPNLRYLEDIEFAELGFTRNDDGVLEFNAPFNHNRDIEATLIDDTMYIFTGVYPLKYTGTGQFEPFFEFLPEFLDLSIYSHNLMVYDNRTAYATGTVIPASGATVVTGLEAPEITAVGSAPLIANTQNQGAIFTIDLKYNIPSGNEYGTSFTSYLDGSTVRFSQINTTSGVSYSTGGYLEMFPRVYYRATGIGAGDFEWIRIEDKDLVYPQRNNRDRTITNDETRFQIKTNADGYFDATADAKTATGVNPILTGGAAVTSTDPYQIKIMSMVTGLYDIKVELVFRYSGFKQDGTTTQYLFEVEDIHVPSTILESVQFNIADIDFNELAREAKALWSCNRVINHYGKLMAYGSLYKPERVFVGHPSDNEYFPEFFTLDFETDTDEIIQRISPFMNILVVQTAGHTWGLKGIDALVESENPYQQFMINPLYGTIAPKSVRPVRNQLYFLSKEGIVSLNSLFANDNQYNIKHIDTNIKNIVPQDTQACAIQYDDQYWIHFPNEDNGMTLRYYIDKKAWVKDTLFEYNGLQEVIENRGEADILKFNSLANFPVTGNTVKIYVANDTGKVYNWVPAYNGYDEVLNPTITNSPKLSEINFNGVHKFIRTDEGLVMLSNPIQLISGQNYRFIKMIVDESIPTDIGEVPRTLFETSYLNQGYPFHYKKYLEQKLDFTIQNEYHKAKEPIIVQDGLSTQNQTIVLDKVNLLKNHSYKVSADKGNIIGVSIAYFKKRGSFGTADVTGVQYLEAPGQVTIVNLYPSSGQAILTWTDLGNETRYIVEYKKAIDDWTGSNVFIQNFDANITLANISGLIAGVEYDFRIKAENNVGPGPYSTESSITIPVQNPIGPSQPGTGTPPGATETTAVPTILGVSTTTSSVTFRVRNNDDDQATVFYYITGGSVNSVVLDADGGSASNISYTGLAAGSYQITAYAQADGENASANVNFPFTISQFEQIPPAPSNLSLNPISFNRVDASWVDNASNEQGFRLRIVGTDGSDSGLFTINSPQTTFVNYQFTGLSENTGYTVYVSAYNSAGDSTQINAQTITPSEPEVTTTVEPSILDLSTGETTVTFRVRNNDASSVTWYYEINDSTPDLNGGTLASGAISSFIELPNEQSNINLTSNTSYTLYVTAQASGEAISTPATQPFTTQSSVSPPETPTAVSWSSFSNQVGFQWQDNSDNENDFEIQMHYNSSYTSQYRTIFANANNTGTTTESVADGTYYARIRARNDAGAQTSGWSNFPGSVTVSASAPSCDPAGTYYGFFCSGTTKVSEYADGNCGIDQVLEYDSTDCGYTPPPTYYTVTYTVRDSFYASRQVLAGQLASSAGVPADPTDPQGGFFAGWSPNPETTTVNSAITIDAIFFG